jgi:C4-dicarboxylate transporter, DctQ subunit
MNEPPNADTGTDDRLPEVDADLHAGPVFLRRAERGLYWCEQVMLVLMLGTLVAVAFFQVAMTVLFRAGLQSAGGMVTSLSWSQGFLRHLVLIIAFLGASLATREGRHLSIDAVTKVLPARLRIILKALIDLVSATICGLLSNATWILMQTEEGVAFRLGTTEVSTRFFFAFVLAGFALIGFRFLVRGARDFWSGWTGELQPEVPRV